MSLVGIAFERPAALVLLAAIPLVAWASRLRRPVLSFPQLPTLMLSGRGLFARVGWLPTALRCLALAATAFALARPVTPGGGARDLSVEGIDIVVALDLSGSMQAVDFQPNDRLFVAKRVLDDFVARRTSDRMGLVVFAGEAYTQCPLTLDHAVFRDILSQVRIGAIADGTAIGNALATSLNRLRDSDAKSKVVILITDGDNNAGNVSPMEAARMASELGIQVYTILVGRECDRPEGCPVPFPAGTDAFGRPVYQKVLLPVNPKLLQDIASTTGAVSYLATDEESLRGNLQDVLARLEKSRLVEARQLAGFVDRFDWLLLPALFLGALELILRSTRMRPFP